MSIICDLDIITTLTLKAILNALLFLEKCN